MIVDKDGYEWGERADAIASVTLFTNRNLMVLNLAGCQISYYQRAVTCHRINKKIAQEIADKAQFFFLGKWEDWYQPITKLEFECLLGLRNKKRDLEEMG